MVTKIKVTALYNGDHKRVPKGFHNDVVIEHDTGGLYSTILVHVPASETGAGDVVFEYLNMVKMIVDWPLILSLSGVETAGFTPKDISPSHFYIQKGCGSGEKMPQGENMREH